MKDYRKIRESTPFIDLCKDAALAAEVTVRAQKKIGADAAIIFSDILLILEPMGLRLEYVKGDGPSISNALRSKKDVESLREADPEETLSFVFEAVKQAKKSLKPDVALIGFAGAPFTLASYMIEGGAPAPSNDGVSRDFKRTRKFMSADAGAWRPLMEKIVRQTTRYLNAQIKAGADALQVFDSWAGTLSAEEYRKYVLPHTAELFAGIKKGIPVIHFGTGTGKFLDLIRSAGGDVIGVDHRIKLDEAWRKIGYDRAIQGNLDPKVLLGSFPEIKRETLRILDEARSRPGHIFNLGHGVLPQTPEENVTALVEVVHEYSRNKN